MRPDSMITGARSRCSRLLRNRLLDQTHDDHDDRAADPASCDLPYDRPDVESAAGRTCDSRDEHAEQLPADAATDNARDGVPDGSKPRVLDQPPAMLPPTAPLISWMIKANRFMFSPQVVVLSGRAVSL